MNTRRIILQDLRVTASVGILDYERQMRQPLVISATFETNAEMPVDDRDIRTVLDYRLLRDALIEEATRGHIDLLETLVERMLERVLRNFPLVLSVHVRVSKPHAFPDCAAVCVEQARLRSEPA